MAPLLLQVPITISGDKPVIGQVVVMPQTLGAKQQMAGQQISATKSRIGVLKRKLKAAMLAYKKTPNPANYKAVEALKIELKSLSGNLKQNEARMNETYKQTLAMLRRKIRQTRNQLKSAKDGKKKVLTDRLNRLIARYYKLRIEKLEELIKRNRANAAAIRRHILKSKNVIAAIVAEEKRQTIPNPALKVRKAKEGMRLKKTRLDLKKANVRYAVLKKRLDLLKSANSRFNTKRMMASAILGQMGATITNLRRIINRHSRLLKGMRKCCKGGKKGCGDLGLARRRLRRELEKLKDMKRIYKRKPTNRLKMRIRNQRHKVDRLTQEVKRIIKCKGLMFCGNLKRAYRNLERAKANYDRVMKIAINRPSDEDSQKARHKYARHIKKYRHEISSIWTCICDRAQKKYHHYKQLYNKQKKPVYRERMLLHKRMLRRCNCRAANINFNRAKVRFVKFRNQYQSNPMDQKSKESMDEYYTKVLEHYTRLKMYKCKLPPLPRSLGKAGGVKVGRKRRR